MRNSSKDQQGRGTLGSEDQSRKKTKRWADALLFKSFNQSHVKARSVNGCQFINMNQTTTQISNQVLNRSDKKNVYI